MVRRLAARALLLACLVVGLAAGAEASAAVTPIALPITSFGAIAVDQANGHVLISSPADNEVVVRNMDGSADTVITGVTDAGAMKIDPTGTYAYAVEQSTSAIAQIDLQTLAVAQTFALGSAAACPGDLAFAKGLIWISYNHSECSGGDSHSGLASLDPTDGAVHAYDLTTDADALIVASPDGNTLYTGQTELDPSQGRRYDITDPADPVQTGQWAGVGTQGECSNLGQLAISPDGQELYLACAAPYQFLTVATADLSSGDTYPASPYPTAIAVTADGSYIAGATTNGTHTAWVFKPGQTTPAIATFDLFDSGHSTVPQGGLAISGDGSKLYVITSGSSFELSVVDNPTLPEPSFAIAPGQTPIGPGVAAHIDGTLRFTDLSSAAGVTLHVSRTNPGGTVTALPDAVTGEGGAITIADMPPAVPGTYTYTLGYDGDSTHASGQAQAAVAVVFPVPVLTLRASRSILTAGGKVTLAAHIGSHGSLNAVTLVSTLWNGLKTSRQVTVGPGGNATIVVSPRAHTSYHLTFAGDSTFAAGASNSVAVSVHASETGVMGGFYLTQNHYHLYHYRASCVSRAHTHCPAFATGVTPNSSRAPIRFQGQWFRDGAWRAAISASGRLNAHSVAGLIIYYTSAQIEGIRFRVRGVFPRTSANLAATSAWQYFRVTA
jgi:WD40 repeat protein